MSSVPCYHDIYLHLCDIISCSPQVLNASKQAKQAPSPANGRHPSPSNSSGKNSVKGSKACVLMWTFRLSAHHFSRNTLYQSFSDVSLSQPLEEEIFQEIVFHYFSIFCIFCSVRVDRCSTRHLDCAIAFLCCLRSCLLLSVTEVILRTQSVALYFSLNFLLLLFHSHSLFVLCI